MKLSKKIVQIALVLSALPVVATAGDAGSIYLMGSLNGLGLGYAASVSKDFAVRGQYNTFKQSFSGNVGDFGAGSRLTVDLNLSSFQVMGDWYPGDGGFRLTGGVVANDNKIDITGTNASVGTGTGATVTSQIKLSKSPAPYIGLGYSTRPKDAKGFGFMFDLGAMIQDPDVTLTATGGVGVTAAQIEAQRVKVQEAVNNLKVMPVIGLGISYSF
jgi:hypothetical protein